MSQQEKELAKVASDLRHDPLAFVYFAWEGVKPHDWQAEILTEIGDKLKAGEERSFAPILEAVASGHGIGKSCLVAWLILWALATESDCKIVVTANTENQLKTKTWSELSKWYSTFRYKHWFKLTATALFSSDANHERLWRADMIPWSERNTEAFAGLHNAGKRILLVFDEGSSIPDVIYEVSEGALTDEGTEIIWVAFGNPTRNSGRFRECFGRFRHRWTTRQVDSRDVPGTNKALIDQWIDDYGEDSDFVRVRVRGEFPRAGSNQLIPTDLVIDAQERDLPGSLYSTYPKYIGVDVARFGDDLSVITRRQGPKVFDMVHYSGIDTMELASYVHDEFKRWSADVCFVDGVGVGGGTVDRLKQLGVEVVDVQSGAQAKDKRTYANVRAELWGNMKEWLDGDVDLPRDSLLKDDLIQPEYGFNNRMQLQLEKKEDMKKRALRSPDKADSLAMTFFADYRKNVSSAPRVFTSRGYSAWD